MSNRFKNLVFDNKSNDEKDKPNENVKYEEPHCHGCVCFDEWSISSDDGETSNHKIIEKNEGYMQYC